MDINLFTEQLDYILKNSVLKLKPCQNRISVPRVCRMYLKMISDLEFDAIKVCEDFIIDGHHRFLAAVMSQKTLSQFPGTKNITQLTFSWSDVSLEMMDYDSEAEVAYHNYNDAIRNGITLKEIEIIVQGK